MSTQNERRERIEQCNDGKELLKLTDQLIAEFMNIHAERELITSKKRKKNVLTKKEIDVNTKLRLICSDIHEALTYYRNANDIETIKIFDIIKTHIKLHKQNLQSVRKIVDAGEKRLITLWASSPASTQLITKFLPFMLNRPDWKEFENFYESFQSKLGSSVNSSRGFDKLIGNFSKEHSYYPKNISTGHNMFIVSKRICNQLGSYIWRLNDICTKYNQWVNVRYNELDTWFNENINIDDADVVKRLVEYLNRLTFLLMFELAIKDTMNYYHIVITQTHNIFNSALGEAMIANPYNGKFYRITDTK